MILVTGASGNVGSKVVANLKATDDDVRALVRSPEKGEALDVPFVVGDLGDPASLTPALEGVDRVFLLSPTGPEQVQLETNVIDAAVEAGVTHIVKLSAIGTDVSPPVRLVQSHATIEAALDRSGIGHTHIRPMSYMDNLLGDVPSIKANDAIYAPLGDAKIAYVDTRDIAEFAAAVLREPAVHAGQAYPLTGPEAFGMAEVADKLSDLLGRRIRYADIPGGDAEAALVGAGVPEWVAGGLVELYAWYQSAHVSLVSPLLPVMLGKPARTLDDFLAEHRALFASS